MAGGGAYQGGRGLRSTCQAVDKHAYAQAVDMHASAQKSDMHVYARCMDSPACIISDDQLVDFLPFGSPQPRLSAGTIRQHT